MALILILVIVAVIWWAFRATRKEETRYYSDSTGIDTVYDSTWTADFAAGVLSIQDTVYAPGLKAGPRQVYLLRRTSPGVWEIKITHVSRATQAEYLRAEIRKYEADPSNPFSKGGIERTQQQLADLLRVPSWQRVEAGMNTTLEVQHDRFERTYPSGRLSAAIDAARANIRNEELLDRAEEARSLKATEKA